MFTPSAWPRKFANKALRLAAGFVERCNAAFGASAGAAAIELGDVAAFRAAGKTAGFIEIADLNGFIPVSVLGANLKHLTGPGLDDGYRNGGTRFVEYLRHPDLAAE